MRKLRRVFRRASLLRSASRRRESARGSRNDSTLRRLSSEALEKRELLAGDLGTAANHNYWNAYDVNDDRQISALDALGVINYLGQSGEGELIAGDGAKMFYDVNADNRISASDALGVINALGRGEEVGEIVELVLTARTANDELITPDLSGDINVEVGERFDLEIAYDDLRVNQFLQPPVELGVFQLFTDVAVSQPGVLMPILNETQRLIIDSALRNEFANSNINQFRFTIPESPPGRSGQLSFTAPLSDFPTNAITNALVAFGYEEEEFEIETLDFGNGPDDDLGYQIHWVGEAFGNVDLPNVSIEVILFNQATSVDTETIEFAPFLADGETPNPDAVRFNINAFSRTYPDQNNPSGTLLYTEGSRGSFDPATGFDEVGGFSREVPITGGGIPEIVGSFVQPFDAFSLPVYLKSEVSDFVVSVNPGEDPEAMLVFGRDDAVPQDFILVETVGTGDSNNNGISQVVLNATVNAPGIIGFDPTSISVDEDAGVATLTVTRTSGSVGDVTVNYSAISGTALSGSDFSPSVGFLEFLDGETTKTLNISLLNDSIIEGNEQFTVVLSDPSGGASIDTATATATVTIVDDEVAVPGKLNLNVATASIDENAGNLTLTVNRSEGSDGIVSVDFTVAGTTASPGSDYTEPSETTLEFQDGETAKNIVVPIVDDSIFEGDETFTVTLGNPTGGATVGETNQTVVTIVDNEVFTPGVFSLASATASFNENAGTLTLTVNREGGTDGQVTVDFATIASGDATEGSDFTPISGTLTFEEGQNTKTIEVEILDDSLIDPDETFSVVIRDPGGGAILSTTKPTTTVVTIIDDENPGTLIFTSSTAQVNEDDGTVTLTVFRDGGTDGVVTVAYATSDGTATNQDYTSQTGTLTFADGVDSQQITVDITDDILIESNETFVVTLDPDSTTGGVQLGSPASVTVTIVEDDVPGELAFSTDTAAVSEDGGSITLTVTRTNGNDGVVTVNYQTVDGTGANGAVAGADYESTSGQLTFGNGDESETITVPITNNTTINPDKVFSVELSSVGGGASIGTPDTVNVTILEDDIELLFNPSAYTVGETVGTASLTVTRIGDTDQEVSVAFETQGDSALPAEDFIDTNATVTFAAGETSKTIAISIVDDNQQEEDETFFVALDPSSITGGATLGATPVATVTIDSEDVAGVLSIQDRTVNEDENTVTLTVSRTNGTDGVISVDYQTVDGTAIAGEDYLSKSDTLTFGHSETTKQIEITIIHDLLGNEGNEIFTVELDKDSVTGGAGVIESQSVAEVTIINVNEAPTATPITIPEAGETLSEEDPDFTIDESDLLAVATDRETDNVLSISNIRVTNGDGQGVSVDDNLNSLAVSPSAYGYLTGSQSAVIQLEYDISDGTNTITNTVTITIAGFNDAPIAVDDLNAIAFKGATSNIRVLDNDDAGDGEDQGLEIISANSPDGDVAIKNDGTLDFTPVADFTGPTTITYKIRDAEGKESDFATVFVEVKEFLPSSVAGFVFIDEVENSASDIAAGADPIRNGFKDSDERGLMGALVSVFSAANDNVTGELVEDTTLTDSDGSFSFGNLAPGTYAITYQSTDAVLFTGQPTRTLEIPVQGGVDATGFDFALLSLAGQVDILASAYFYRDGGVVSLDDSGVQEFVTSLDGYAEDVKFVEFALSSTRDTALLTIVEDDKEVKTAQLSSRDFRLFGDAAFFFRGQDELSFLDEGEIAGLVADYPSYRDAVDQVLADM